MVKSLLASYERRSSSLDCYYTWNYSNAKLNSSSLRKQQLSSNDIRNFPRIASRMNILTFHASFLKFYDIISLNCLKQDCLINTSFVYLSAFVSTTFFNIQSVAKEMGKSIELRRIINEDTIMNN